MVGTFVEPRVHDVPHQEEKRLTELGTILDAEEGASQELLGVLTWSLHYCFFVELFPVGVEVCLHDGGATQRLFGIPLHVRPDLVHDVQWCMWRDGLVTWEDIFAEIHQILVPVLRCLTEQKLLRNSVAVRIAQGPSPVVLELLLGD